MAATELPIGSNNMRGRGRERRGKTANEQELKGWIWTWDCVRGRSQGLRWSEGVQRGLKAYLEWWWWWGSGAPPLLPWAQTCFGGACVGSSMGQEFWVNSLLDAFIFKATRGQQRSKSETISWQEKPKIHALDRSLVTGWLLSSFQLFQATLRKSYIAGSIRYTLYTPFSYDMECFCGFGNIYDGHCPSRYVSCTKSQSKQILCGAEGEEKVSFSCCNRLLSFNNMSQT